MVNRRWTVAGVAALLLLLLAAALVFDGGHRRGPVAAQRPGGVTSPGSTSPPSPTLSGEGRPSPAASGTTAGGSGSGPTPSTSAPTPAGTPPPPPPYVFNPQPSASGSTPSTHFLAGDLTLPAGQQVLATFTVSSAGSVSLHAFPEGSSSYPIGSLLACLQYAGQTCSPAAFPNPAYWTVSAIDLTQHQAYQLRVVGTTAPGGQLIGMGFGWNGAHRLTLAGIDLPGQVCSGATGYTAGCGIRFKFTAAAAGNLAVAVSPGVEIHLNVQDKSTGTVACDVKFIGSTGCPLPSPAQWTGHLYPQTRQAVNPATLTLNWP